MSNKLFATVSSQNRKRFFIEGLNNEYYKNKIIFIEPLLDNEGNEIEPAAIVTNGKLYAERKNVANQNVLSEERVIEIIQSVIKANIDSNYNETQDWKEYTDEMLDNPFGEYNPDGDENGDDDTPSAGAPPMNPEPEDVKLGYVDTDGKIVVYEAYHDLIYKYEYENFNPIENFRPIMADELNFVIHNVAPYGTKQIGVYTQDNERLGSIDLEHMNVINGERLYRVGLTSDVHYEDNDGTAENTMNDNVWYNPSLINMFDFLNNKNDVEFTCISGDITTDRTEHITAFKEMRDKYSPNTPVYVCRGNHDHKAFHHSGCDYELWNSIACPIEKYETYYFDKNEPLNIYSTNEFDKASFYFKRPLPNGKEDIFIFLSLEYSNTGSSASISSEINDLQYYSQDSLKWFMCVLNEYRNNRCFVFTHQFFEFKAGNNSSGYLYDYVKSHSKEYVVSGKNLEVLTFLNNYYKNAVWFSGHSHYKWDWAKIDNKINVCNWDSINNCECAWNVHIPSLSRPLIQDETYKVKADESECGIMDIYEDCIDIRGIECKTDLVSNYFGIYNLSDTFITNEDKYISINDFNDTENVKELENNFIEVTFNGVKEYHITSDTFDKTYSSQTPILYIEEVYVYDMNGNDITNEALDTCKLGFRFEDVYLYSMYTDCPLTRYNTETNKGLVFKLSSEYPLDPNVVVRFKGKIKFVNNINYLNKYTPIGTYRLPTNRYIIDSFGTTNIINDFIDSYSVSTLTYEMPLISETGQLNMSLHKGYPIIETVLENGEEYIDILFYETKQQITVNDEYVKSLNNVLYAHLNLSYVRVTLDDGTVVDDTADYLNYIGFYRSDSDKYTLKNGINLDVVSLDNNAWGCELNCSSRYTGPLPISIRLKGSIIFYYTV